MEQAKQYLERYRQAQTREERRAVVLDYKTFFNSLTNEEQKQAQTVMNVLWPSIEQNVSEMEKLTEQIEIVLRPKAAYEK